MRRPPTGEEAQPQPAPPVRRLEQAADEDAGSRRRPRWAGTARARPTSRWWRSMKPSRSRDGSVGIDHGHARRRPRRGGSCAGSRGAPSCRACRGTPRSRRPREGHDRADVLPLAHDRPAAVAARGPERVGQGVGGRVAAAQAAQVDDVPGHRMVVGDRGRASRDGRRAPSRPPAGRPARPGSWRSRRGTRRRRRRPWRWARPGSAALRCRAGSSSAGRPHRARPRGDA